MSAFGGKADIANGLLCPLMTQSGHCGTRQEPEAVLCRVIPGHTALKSEERCFIRDVGPPFLILGGLRVAVSSANERTHELRRSR